MYLLLRKRYKYDISSLRKYTELHLGKIDKTKRDITEMRSQLLSPSAEAIDLCRCQTQRFYRQAVNIGQTASLTGLAWL